MIPYLDDWLIHHPDHQVLLRHQAQLISTLDLVGFILTLDLQFSRNPFTPGLRGSFPSRVQSVGDSCSRTPSILPPGTNLFSSVPAYGITHLGLRSYPSGSFVPETPSMSFSLFGSDRPAYATASIRSTGPCLNGTGRTYVFLPQESLSAHFRRNSRFLRTLPFRSGALTWEFPRFRVPGPIQTASSISIVWSSRL